MKDSDKNDKFGIVKILQSHINVSVFPKIRPKKLIRKPPLLPFVYKNCSPNSTKFEEEFPKMPAIKVTSFKKFTNVAFPLCFNKVTSQKINSNERDNASNDHPQKILNKLLHDQKGIFFIHDEYNKTLNKSQSVSKLLLTKNSGLYPYKKHYSNLPNNSQNNSQMGNVHLSQIDPEIVPLNIMDRYKESAKKYIEKMQKVYDKSK